MTRQKPSWTGTSMNKPKAYRWSSVQIGGRGKVPVSIWIRPAKSKAGESTGIEVTFDSLDDVQRLTQTLQGFLAAKGR